jgi:transposase InsO family protein
MGSGFHHVKTWQGFVYVAFVIDVFVRYIVGWKVSSSGHADFVLDALEQALHDRQPQRDSDLIHHSVCQKSALRHPWAASEILMIMAWTKPSMAYIKRADS